MRGVRSRRRREGTAVGLAGTVTIHAALVGALLVGGGERTVPAPTYRVSLVAAPRPAERRAPEALERPAEQPAPAPPTERRRPTAPAPPAERPPKPTEPAPRSTPAVEPLPGERPATGSDIATVETPGVEFPFPDYLTRLVAEVYRRWQRPESNQALEAEVQFFVHRDGSISNLHFTKRSGSFGFDLEAQGAIEQAGRAGAFGPLPEEYPADILPVTFFFTPRSGQ